MEENKILDNNNNQIISNQARGGLERIISFSDAVMAIAITLLIIEMIIPTVNTELLISELISLIPKFFSHLISFFIIGSYWISHHRMFTYISRYDNGLLWFNLLFLFFVSFLPFPSALLGEYTSVPLIIIIYSTNIIFLSVSLLFLWVYASQDYRLISRNINPQIIKNIKWINLFGPLGFLISIPFTFISIFAAFIVWWLTPIIGLLYRRISKKWEMK
jgi:uncharacterized membrane protein